MVNQSQQCLRAMLYTKYIKWIQEIINIFSYENGQRDQLNSRNQNIFAGANQCICYLEINQPETHIELYSRSLSNGTAYDLIEKIPSDFEPTRILVGSKANENVQYNQVL